MKRVYVLGSGFSVKAGAPLSRSVLKEIFHSPSRTEENARLESFLGQFLFRTQVNWVTESGLEEVLSRLDLIRHYKPYPGVNYDEVSFFEELLLKEFAKLLHPGKTAPLHPSYGSFGKILEKGDTIISFNYDLVLENLLTACHKSFSYCLGEADGEVADEVVILKLHGSINLFYCPICSEVYNLPPAVSHTGSMGTASGHVCVRCCKEGLRVPVKHFIIAPTLFKSYTVEALRRLWFTALQALARADEVIFIGYSLPEADVLSYQLFDFSRRMTAGRQSAILVNGPRLCEKRFKYIYGNDLLNTRSYFEEWINIFAYR